jgi:hypothetical protein
MLPEPGFILGKAGSGFALFLTAVPFPALPFSHRVFAISSS